MSINIDRSKKFELQKLEWYHNHSFSGHESLKVLNISSKNIRSSMVVICFPRVHVQVRIRALEKLIFRKILPTYLVDDPVLKNYTRSWKFMKDWHLQLFFYEEPVCKQLVLKKIFKRTTCFFSKFQVTKNFFFLVLSIFSKCLSSHDISVNSFMQENTDRQVSVL